MAGTTRKTDVFIVGGGPAGVAAGIAARQKGLSVLVADGAEPPIDKPCRERGAVTYMRTLRRVCTGNVALVGDASGGVDAITGDGLRLAFQHALALAEAIESRNLREYEMAHKRLAQRPRQMGRVLLLLGRNATIRERALQALGARPQLFERFLAIHQGHGSMGDLVSAGAMLGWQFLAA